MAVKGKVCAFLVSFLCCTVLTSVSGQDQKVADSLYVIYRENRLSDTAKMELLRNLSFNEVKDLDLSLKFAEELISLSVAAGNHLYQYRGYLQKGNKKRLKGDLQEAIEAYFKSAEAAKKAGFAVGEGTAYSAIADVYSISNNHSNSERYYDEAIRLLRESGDSIVLGSVILNAGDEFLNNKKYKAALRYFKESQSIFEKAGYPVGEAYSLGNIGMVYANTGNRVLAEKNINKAIGVLEALEDYYPICVYLLSMSDIYLERGEQQSALNYAARSLELAQRYGLKDQVSDASLKLSELYEKAGQTGESLRFFKNHIVYRDSVRNIKTVQQIANLRTDYEVARKQAEVDLLNQEKRNQRIKITFLFIILGLVTVLLGTLYWYYRSISREKKRSEGLLLNILPAETAKELKQSGRVDAVRFEQVTVLFTDFVQFTKVAEKVEPEQLVRSLDFYFKGFDEITSKYGLEKIKTIGDSYMCASGLPTAQPLHARQAVMAAREMVELVKKEWQAQDGLSHFEVRIGVHTGPVVAGIVGFKKWQYDIWGDTVNIASRLEALSEPGRINLSETTWQEIKDEFECEPRGEIEVKNKGTLKMYFLV